MSMHYRTNDGQGLHAQSPEGLVRELHKLSLSPSVTDRAFMRDTAGRVKLMHDKRVRCGTAEHFVHDLLAIGLLVEIEEEDAA